MQTSFFLGANSKYGFHSFYHALIDLDSAENVYIIKGSPGCGKSSFMRRVQAKLTQAGYDIEEIKCSSDPDSLDGIVIPKLRSALVDGTSPHIVEPAYPVAVEQYLDLSVFADVSAIKEERSAIKELFKKYKSFYKRAYRLTACAASIANDAFDTALGAANISKLEKKASGIISREIKASAGTGRMIPRFLSSISPAGYVTLFDSIVTLAERIYVLEDSFGLASFMLHPIKDAAVAAGHDVICCFSPLIPERLEHIIIPSLSLAFVSSSKQAPFPYEYTRHIRIDASLDTEVLRAKKQKLNFSRKLYTALIDEACATIADAKAHHDELEAVYNPHIDFERVYALADETAEKLLGNR